MESAAATHTPDGALDGTAPGNKGLKADALGYVSNLVIAIASTAPAYSMAATLGFIVAVGGVGVHAPAVMIVSFIPILFVSVGYRFLNLADPDAGTTFAWVTRAFGPQLGWINGWAIFLADIIVMASLAAIASKYSFLLFDSTASPSNFLIILGAVVWIAVMTWICYRGIELSARVQSILLSFEIVTLALFAVVALVKVYANSPAHSIQVSASWFNPFDLSWGALVDAVLLGIFIYWGWDSGVAVNEESRDKTHGPGKAAVISTVILLLIYVVVSVAAQAYHGTGFLTSPANQSDVLNALGIAVFGSPLDKLMIIAVLTSASASTQTTILPTARTTLSMARWGALPKRIRHRASALSHSDLLDLADGRAVDRLDGGAACLQSEPERARGCGRGARLCRLLLLRVHRAGLRAVLPPRAFQERPQLLPRGPDPGPRRHHDGLRGVKAYGYYNTAGNNYSKPFLGIQTPIFIGIGGLILGIVLMFASWPFFGGYFRRRGLEAADPAAAGGGRQPVTGGARTAPHTPEPARPGAGARPPRRDRRGNGDDRDPRGLRDPHPRAAHRAPPQRGRARRPAR